MAASLPRPSTDENISTTLSAGITDIATTMTVSDASKIVSPCYLVIDRVDSSGTQKATSLWEYVKVTNVSGSDLTITRAQGGSTQQAHGSGAVVEAVVTSSFFEDWYAVLNPEHDSAGGHVITGTMTVAGMNLASVATIAVGSFVGLRSTGYINASGASLSGFVTPTSTDTLTNKTLTSPKINEDVALTPTATELNLFDESLAWTSFNPTITSEGGSVTGENITKACAYTRIGKTIIARYFITITSKGSGSPTGAVLFTYPVAPETVAHVNGFGGESQVTGYSLTVVGSASSLYVYKYDGTTMWVDGYKLDFTAIYKVA